MSYMDLIYIALFSLLYFNKHTRLASCVFVSCYVLFLVLHNTLPNGYTYISSGFCHLIIFSALAAKNSKTYFIVSLISICMIFVNIQGYMNYEKYLPPDEYNYVYTLFLNTQLALLYMRAILNGLVGRFNFKRGIVQFILDSSIETASKKNKEQEE